MRYQPTPPITEAMVAVSAIRHQLARSARTIGIIITSGGIIKIELSIKDTNANHHFAWRCAAADRTLLYNVRNDLVRFSYVELWFTTGFKHRQ